MFVCIGLVGMLILMHFEELLIYKNVTIALLFYFLGNSLSFVNIQTVCLEFVNYQSLIIVSVILQTFVCIFTMVGIMIAPSIMKTHGFYGIIMSSFTIACFLFLASFIVKCVRKKKRKPIYLF